MQFEGGIILAKRWLDHSYTFWTIANYTYYTSMKFADSHVSTHCTVIVFEENIIQKFEKNLAMEKEPSLYC